MFFKLSFFFGREKGELEEEQFSDGSRVCKGGGGERWV